MKDPEKFGSIEFDGDGKVLSIEEKPKQPKCNYTITGFYFYQKVEFEMAEPVKSFARGELKITT